MVVKRSSFQWQISRDFQEPARLKKPRVLLAILTPVNLLTGVLACGLICSLTIWMDRRWLPPALQPPQWLLGWNIISALTFTGLGLKGFWDNENCVLIVLSMLSIFAAGWVLAVLAGPRLKAIARRDV